MRTNPAQLEPSELTAAVLTGAAVTAALRLLTVPEFPALFLGLIIWAALCNSYRRRWTAGPALPGRNPDPGS